jgi:Xaa-Pro aminopeptidase
MTNAPQPYADQRARFLAALAPRSAAALVFSGSPRIRNHDAEHRFRPESDFWYLTGFAEPESALLLLPARRAASSTSASAAEGRELPPRAVLFLREKSRDEEIWHGRRLGVDAAPQALGLERAYPIAELWQRLPELLRGYERLVYRSGLNEAQDRAVLAALARLREKHRGPHPIPYECVDPAPILHELRLYKDPRELELMRRAAQLSERAHRAAMARSAPGVNEAEIDALLSYCFRAGGGGGSAYTNIVAGGANACILHYVENNAPLRAGELLLVDAGAEYDCYASDVTRTWPVTGRFSPEQRALYELVLRAQLAAIEEVGPGKPFPAAHEAAVRVLAAGLVELGLLPGPVQQVLESESYKRFYMHRTGHWLGLDVHDCGAYSKDAAPRLLEPGMVTTVEPGLYIAAEDELVEPRWRGIGIRIEDDVLVTEAGCEVLTAAIPKTIAELERACAASDLLAAPAEKPAERASKAVSRSSGKSAHEPNASSTGAAKRSAPPRRA